MGKRALEPDWLQIARADRDAGFTIERTMDNMRSRGLAEDRARLYANRVYAAHGGRMRLYGALSALGGVALMLVVALPFLHFDDKVDSARRRANWRPNTAHRDPSLSGDRSGASITLGLLGLGGLMIVIGGRYLLLGADRLRAPRD